MNWLALYVISLLTMHSAVAQNEPLPDFPKNDFRSPLNGQLLLTGNFGETRKSHFHSGIDIKTKEKEGLPIFAVADGYVSRINVSPFGYGNALYITHPNGYVSVYAHIRNFNATVTQVLRKEQYASKSFSQNIILPPNYIPVKQGDVIALSGNSGGSAGPHLHFEIRDSLERIINPLHFGFEVKDSIPPLINAVEFFPLGNDLLTKNKKRIAVKLNNGEYSIPFQKINSTQVGIAVNAYDKMTGTNNTYGIYSIEATDNDKPFFTYKADRFSFSNTRQIISHLDYETFLSENHRAFHKCFVEPHNTLEQYTDVVNSGVIDLSDKIKHNIQLLVRDFAGNTATVRLEIQHNDSSRFFTENKAPYTLLLHKDSLNTYKNDNLSLSIPANALINSTRLHITSKNDTSSAIYSPVFTLNKNTEHLLSYYTIALKSNVPPHLREKAILVWRSEKKEETSKGGTFENGFIQAKAREFGTFYVKIDTTLPTIKPLSFNPEKPVGIQPKWTFIIKDNFGKPEKYNAFLDDEWVLAEFDAKSGQLTIPNEKKLSPGKHKLRIEVEDERRNKAIYSTTFIY